MSLSSLPRSRGRLEERGIVGGAGPKQMVDDFEQFAREDREGLLLGAPTIQQALVRRVPFGPAADRDQGSHVEGMTQGSGSAFGQAALTSEASAVVRARLQTGIGDHLVDSAEAG